MTNKFFKIVKKLEETKKIVFKLVFKMTNKFFKIVKKLEETKKNMFKLISIQNKSFCISQKCRSYLVFMNNA